MPSWDGMRKKTIAGRAGGAQRGLHQGRPTPWRRQWTDVGAERADGPDHVVQAPPRGEHGAGVDKPRSDRPVRLPDGPAGAKPTATGPAAAAAPVAEDDRPRSEPDPSLLCAETVASTDRWAEHGIRVSRLVVPTPRRADGLRPVLAAGRIVTQEPDPGRHLSARHAPPLAVMSARDGPIRQMLQRRKTLGIAIARALCPAGCGLRRHGSQAGLE